MEKFVNGEQFLLEVADQSAVVKSTVTEELDTMDNEDKKDGDLKAQQTWLIDSKTKQ
jgi:hypothetical protein